METERWNALAAMERAYQDEQWEMVCRFAYALGAAGGYLYARGYWGELRARLEQAIHAAETKGSDQDNATFMHNLAILAQHRGDYAKAQDLCQRGLHIKIRLGNPLGIANSLGQLGNLAYMTGDHIEAQRLYEQSLAIAEELGNQAGIAIAVHQLGIPAQERG